MHALQFFRRLAVGEPFVQHQPLVDVGAVVLGQHGRGMEVDLAAEIQAAGEVDYHSGAPGERVVAPADVRSGGTSTGVKLSVRHDYRSAAANAHATSFQANTTFWRMKLMSREVIKV